MIGMLRGTLAASLLGLLVATGFTAANAAVTEGKSVALGEPPKAPILRIEPGMHTAMINRMAVSGGTLVTASDDKTARLWDLSTGRPLSVLRPPIATDDEGALYAVAAAPSMIAVGGRTGRAWDPDGAFCIYLFAPDGSRMLGRIGNLRAPVISLAFSPDGRYLAVGMQGKGGLRVLDMQAKGVALEQPFNDTVTWIDFDRTGRMAVASAEGVVKTFTAAMQPEGEVRVDQPWGLAFSPDGNRLAVGGNSVTVLDARRLTPLAALAGDGAKKGNLSVVAWSGDGTALLAGGGYTDGRSWYLRRWSGANLAKADDLPVAGRTITSLQSLPDGRLAVATTEPRWSVVDQAGKQAVGRGPLSPEFRQGYQNWLKVSLDGAVVEFPFDVEAKRVMRFDLNKRSLSAASGGADLVKPGIAPAAGNEVSGWQNGTVPTIGGVPVALDANEISRSLAAQGDMVVLGTDFYLRAYRSRKPLWSAVLPAAAWGVSLTPDGRKVVAALADGSIRWFARDTGKEQMALFTHADGKRWVVWTPAGYFDTNPVSEGSGRGDALVGYHVNRERNREGEFVRVEQLYSKFARRDMVMAAFRGTTAAAVEAKALTEAFSAGLPPKVGQVEYCDTAGCKAQATRSVEAVSANQSEVTLKVKVEDRGAGIGKVRVVRNGVVVDSQPTVISQDKAGRVETHRVALEAGENEVLVSAFDAKGVMEAKDEDRSIVRIKYSPPASDGRKRPTLYVFSVGVSQYPSYPGLTSLDNTVNDARAVSTAMLQGKLEDYEKVHSYTLLDKQATKAEIMAQLADLASRAKPEDSFVFFLAGHGFAVDGRYYFVPSDVGQGGKTFNQSIITRDGVSQADLSAALAKVKAARGLLLLDTCFSSSLQIKDDNETTSAQLSEEVRRPILAAAVKEALDGPQEAVKGLAESHGNFTTFLLLGMKGEADLNKNGKIDIMELAYYVMERVPEEAKKQEWVQEPTFTATALRKFDVSAAKK